MLTVAEIMTREPYTLTAEHTLLDARNMMAEHHIRHIPIVSSEHVLIGIVSQRDVLATAHSNVFRKQSAAEGQELDLSLSAVMTHPVQTVEEGASLRGTAMHLQKNYLGCLPVVRDHLLIGIITDSDFVGVAINLMEQLEAAEPLEELDDDMV